MNQINRKFSNFFKKKGADKTIYGAVSVLICFGIVMIGSASVGAVSSKGLNFVLKNMGMQAAYAVIGIIAMMILSKKFDNRWVNHRTSLLVYWIGIASMCVCRLWRTKGSYAWIHLGPITIQPAEFMKIAMILILSYFLTETDAAFVVKGKFRTNELKKQFYKKKLIGCVIKPIGMMLFVAIIGIGVQHDFGSTAILAAICFICFMVTTRPYYKTYKKIIWIAVIACIVVGLIVAKFFLQSYQLARITTWLNPLENIYGDSWQLLNSMIAFANGQLFGRGFGNSIQKYDYISESHNDFIGAIIYEELGIVGLAFIIIPTAIIIFRLLKYADKIQDNRSRIILTGVASYFFLHLFVNLGGISGMIPMTGVPLLLVSYGGSSTLATLMGIGICQSIIARYNKDKLRTDASY